MMRRCAIRAPGGERFSPGTTVPGLTTERYWEDYLAPSVPGLEPLCLRCGFVEVVGACAPGFDSGLEPLTFRASLPPLTMGALFAVCCSRCRAFFAEASVSTGFISSNVGAVLVCACGTLGVGAAGVDSVVTGRDGLRPRLWD